MGRISFRPKKGLKGRRKVKFSNVNLKRLRWVTLVNLAATTAIVYYLILNQ